MTNQTPPYSGVLCLSITDSLHAMLEQPPEPEYGSYAGLAINDIKAGSFVVVQRRGDLAMLHAIDLFGDTARRDLIALLPCATEKNASKMLAKFRQLIQQWRREIEEEESDPGDESQS